MTERMQETRDNGHSGGKWTRNQRLVLDVLQKGQQPVTAYEILEELRGFGFRAPLQVYRALERLTEAGAVHRLESLNAFVACHHIHTGGGETVAFAICDSCSSVSELHDTEMASRLASLCAATGFTAVKTTLEIRGRCAACSVAPAA